jgi:hypothetical protein
MSFDNDEKEWKTRRRERKKGWKVLRKIACWWWTVEEWRWEGDRLPFLHPLKKASTDRRR